MGLSNLAPPKGAKHAKKRIGRGQGSGQGKTAGRGHREAKSRSGFKFKRRLRRRSDAAAPPVPKRGFTTPFVWNTRLSTSTRWLTSSKPVPLSRPNRSASAG